MTQDPYIVLHGGFHKTATSHIQSTLARNSKQLQRAGVSYVNHRTTRKRLTIPVQCNAFEKIGIGWDPKISDTELTQMTAEFFDEVLLSKPERVIVSDENIAGHCGHCVRRGGLYRWRHKLLETFADQFPNGVDEVHLGIRNYADFFASAYVEYLRSVNGKWFVDEQTMRLNVMSKMPNWNAVLTTIAEIFSRAKIFVWRYEDFRKIDQRIFANLCGSEVDVADLKEPKDQNKRPTASGRAVRELLQLIHKDGADAALQRRVELQETYPRGKEFGSYNPWTEQERTHLTNIYARDIEEIKMNPNVEFLEFGYA
ncbi:MAG: hypothetical protein AAGK67_00030 [Pseudomonadota bacterium]